MTILIWRIKSCQLLFSIVPHLKIKLNDTVNWFLRGLLSKAFRIEFDLLLMKSRHMNWLLLFQLKFWLIDHFLKICLFLLNFLYNFFFFLKSKLQFIFFFTVIFSIISLYFKRAFCSFKWLRFQRLIILTFLWSCSNSFLLKWLRSHHLKLSLFSINCIYVM